MSNNFTNNSQPNSDLFSIEEQRSLGLILILICSSCSIVYIPVLWVFVTRSYFYEHVSYRLMIHMGFIELMNMMCLVEFGLTLFDVGFTPLVGKIVSAAWTFDWWMLNFITMILALNRSDVMIGFLSYFFTNKGKEDFFKTILYISYVISFAVFALYMIPGFQVYSQGFETLRDEYNQIIVPIGRIIALALYGISYVLYICAFINLVLLRFKTSVDKKIITRHEMSLFIQAVIICGYKSGITLFKNYTDAFSGDNKTMYYIFWIANYLEIGYNPFMYLAFNKRLRREIHAMLTNKTIVTSITVKPQGNELRA